MTRIYTIPARDVVEGMRLVVDGWPRGVVGTVRVSDVVSAMVRDVQWVWEPHTTIAVMLPGPSPCDTEENGGVCRCGAGVMGEHAKGCPAEGLLLWPVGAAWEPRHGSKWPGVWRIGSYRVDHDAVGDLRADLRAAFCEPEVQPCPECFDKGVLHTWVDDDSCTDGGYEGPERHCTCAAGERLRERE